ncbi:RNB-domain-containing protein [Neocallimastix californiae]|uniref:Ribosomal RNA-processing protein 44 n=1 Tax=Neocallimastix californiae TaxID=1754190 RepID=A0A1Y2APV3_9FUNG|nr:RNB-domain-containing protein [Neocallimastix californiae]|eukprot:ORY24609.1 RNB-domain-containing protein [Neocallimastix californiae]
MLKSRAFVKRTRKGNVIKVIKEHYLRDDIWCSVEGCDKCKQEKIHLSCNPRKTKLSEYPQLIIPDTNIFLHQIDIIEHVAFTNVIVLQTVLDEVRARSLQIYNRIRTMLEEVPKHFYLFSNEHNRHTAIERLKDETMNDRNDRAIRTATLWYNNHLKSHPNGQITVLLVTDDKDNRVKAQQEGIKACSMSEYVEEIDEYPELIDMVAYPTEDDTNDKKFTYEEHMTPVQISGGLKAGLLYQGSINISIYNYLEGTIMANIDGEETQILISGRASLNRAIQGDTVAVKLLPKEEWKTNVSKIITTENDKDDEDNEVEDKKEDDNEKESPNKMETDKNDENVAFNEKPIPTGKVVGIIKKNWRQYCGSIDKNTVQKTTNHNATQNILVVSMDRRIPKIRIRTRQAQALMGKRIVVAIDSWGRNSLHPFGHFVRDLGDIGDRNTETEVLLLEHDVPYMPFSQQVLNDLPPEEDLRYLDVCSIDPPGCTDIDDALHVRSLPNGNYEVGVHIADVTYFVKPNTAMDKEAAKRGTTVYLVDKRIDMLPALLGTNLCSLRSNVDRLAFSCIWELTPEAEIVNVHFTKSVIRSRASLSYEEAQDRNDDERMNDNITKGIRILNGLAKKLKKKRMDNGALTLASPEVRFNLENDSQDPVDVEMKELKETNSLVEEFMLLANISVAKKIHSKYPESSLLRRHPTPPQSNFDVLIAAAESVGIKLECSSSKELADSLDKAIIPEQPYFNKLIRIMTTRCMMQAVYFSSGTVSEKDYWHYGLATEIYTHFTSPIRRYSDVIVHRLLAAAIDYGEGYSTDIIDKMKIQKICDVLNFRHRMAQQASRSSVELFTNLYFKDRIVEEEGFIIRILKNGFVVLIPRYGIESIIYSESNNKSGTAKQIFTYEAKENKLVSEYATLKIFDKVTVQISIEEAGVAGISSKLSMKLVKPFVPGISVESQNIKMDDKQLHEIDDEIKNRIEIIKEEEEAIQNSNEPSSKKRRVA